MGQSEDRGRKDVRVYVGGALALAICCGGPLLVGAVIATGLGGWLVSDGAVLAGSVVLAAGAVVAALLGRKVLRTHRGLSRAREKARR